MSVVAILEHDPASLFVCLQSAPQLVSDDNDTGLRKSSLTNESTQLAEKLANHRPEPIDDSKNDQAEKRQRLEIWGTAPEGR